jgi:Protein of unknown function (DUF4013)
MNDINFKYTGNFGETLTYMFKDPKWVGKVLLGALFGIIPILNFVTAGYALRVIDNVRSDTEPPLPEWGGDLGQLWIKGLVLVVIGFIYGIPLWILSGIAGGVGASSQSGGATAVAVIFGLLAFVYAILWIFWIQGAIVNYATKGNFAAAFEFGTIWDLIKRNAGRMLLTVVFVVVVSLIIGVVGGVLRIIPCIGCVLSWIVGFAAWFYTLLVVAHNCGIIAKSLNPPAAPLEPVQ